MNNSSSSLKETDYSNPMEKSACSNDMNNSSSPLSEMADSNPLEKSTCSNDMNDASLSLMWIRMRNIINRRDEFEDKLEKRLCEKSAIRGRRDEMPQSREEQNQTLS
uniref:Uncharacterized protein n=1 Tax=Sphaerodactylus townsendi TaxID=933632 RepID=A0ACB8GDB5_9SAUR